jgi:hypothetical protein
MQLDWGYMAVKEQSQDLEADGLAPEFLRIAIMLYCLRERDQQRGWRPVARLM